MGRGVSVPLSCRFFSVHCDSYPNGPMFRLMLQPSQPHSRQQYGGQNKERDQRMITNCLIRRVPRRRNTSFFFFFCLIGLNLVKYKVHWVYSFYSRWPVVPMEEGGLGQLEMVATLSPPVTLRPHLSTPSSCPSLTGAFLHSFIFFCMGIIT